MKLSTHLSATMLALPIAIAQVPHPPLNVLMFCGICMGTVAPDADARGKSPIISAIKEIKRAGKRINLGGLFAIFAALLTIPGLIIGGILELLVYLLKLEHRGVLHTPLFAIAIALLGGIIFLMSAEIGIMIIGLSIGWIMHLVLDSLTPSGINWFGHRITGPVVTSSWADDIIAKLLILFGTILTAFVVYNMR